jgi:hypothetical protein
MTDFWKYFEQEAEPRLDKRAKTFRQIFEYLDQQSGSILIIETGVARQPDNWAGDGQSTIMFDRYVTARGPDSHVHAVDISEDSVTACRSMVGDQTTVHLQDSVKFLDELARGTNSARPNLVYLDSYDLDWDYWFASAAHCIKEFAAITPLLNSNTLLVTDDSPPVTHILASGEQTVIAPAKIAGKGRLLAEYADQIGVTPYFAQYQAGWIGL